MSRTSGVALEGLGEAAFVLEGGHVLMIWHDGYAIQITNQTDTPLETNERVARAVLARL